ncbi:hypothetical protein D9M70_440960 [compost metagenome]
MGDEDEGHAERLLQQLEFVLDRLAQIGIERAERLVEKQDIGFDHQATRQCDALPLAAREAIGLLVGDIFQSERRQDAIDLGITLRLGHAFHVEPVTDIAAHRHVREERVALEDHRGRPVFRPNVVHALALDQHLAGGERFEAGDHAQRRRLAAA